MPSYVGLAPAIWALGWVSFRADVASEMTYPLLPLLGGDLRALVLVAFLLPGLGGLLLRTP